MIEYKVIWTYVANYGINTILAETPEQAAEVVRGFYADEFKQKANLYVVPTEHLTIVPRLDGKQF